MIPRTEMDIAVVGPAQPDSRTAPSPRPASASAPSRPPCCWSRRRQGADRLKARRRGAGKAAAACSAACRPIDDKRGTIAYRTKVAGVLLKRTAAIAAKRAPGK